MPTGSRTHGLPWARIAAEKLTTNVALKLTHLGLDLGEGVALRNVTRIVERAATHGNFIRLDMEESARVDVTISIYQQLRAAGHDNVGTVLQSYLYRTPGDLEALLPLAPNLRLVKGAYLEPADIAFPKKPDVDAAYISLVERMLERCSFTAVATHDERIIQHVIDFTARKGIGKDRFEFQMLYGVRRDLQEQIVKEGYRMRVYVPFGSQWYPYLMRRLAERPANIAFMAGNIVKESLSR